MIDESTLKLLHKLSADLVMVDISSPLEEWRAIADSSERLSDGLKAAGEDEAKELADLMKQAAVSLFKGIIANPGTGVKVIRNIIGALQGLDSDSGMSESLRKQAHAEATLFFRDVKKEESRVKAATTFQDDEEEREMLLAIEARIDELEADLLNLDPPESDSENVRSIFRQFHTLKGEGAICGHKAVADFCHGIETEIEDARSGNLVLTAEMIYVLQELTGLIRPILAGESREEIGEDLIEALMNELREAILASKKSGLTTIRRKEDEIGEDKFADFFSGFNPPPEEMEQKGDDQPEIPEEEESEEDAAAKAAIMAELLGDAPASADDPGESSLLSEFQQVEPETESSRAPSTSVTRSLTAADFLAAIEADNDQSKENRDGMEDTDSPDETEKPHSPAAETNTDLIDIVVMEPIAETVKDSSKRKSPQASPNDTVIESGELMAAAGSQRAKKETVEKKVDETKIKAISIDVHRLDELMELVGEVSLLGSYLTIKMQGQEGLSLQAVNLSRACGRLQEMTNALRMTSIRPLFMTVRRAAADAARASRKMIDINMRGIDTQVDRAIVESLSAALIHIIRNAVDHGIESTDERRRVDKPERGSIIISALRTNSDIVIELGDDGKGFDLDAIHQKAVKMGKIAPDARLTEEEVAALVFLPGLSTATKVTGLSGRGVGMEIVHESIDSLRGKVEIKTEKGKGSTVRLRFPLMVAAMEAMMVRVGDNILALPVSQVRECFRPSPGDIGTIKGGGAIVTIRGVILPILSLSQEFGIRGEAERPEDGILVVVETGEMLTAVMVDETIGSSQVVVRSMEGPLAQSTLVAGAAILPDGSIGMVIETSKLTERVSITAAQAFSEAGRKQADSSRQVDTVSIGSNQVGMIDFNIKAPGEHGRERVHVFAINAFKTREFVPLTQLRSIPNSPPGFAGIMMLRDNTVPVVHMGVVLGLMSEHERKPEWEQIVLICEFAGRTVGFLVTSVERVSYISWSDIMPPPSTGGLIQIEYIVGTILMSRLKGTRSSSVPAANSNGEGDDGQEADESGESGQAAQQANIFDEAQVAFVLDFERIVGNVMQLYGDMGSELGDMSDEGKSDIKILLVEDSPLIRKRTNKALSAAGINVIEAGDGQEAWDIIEQLRRDADEKNESIFSRVDLILSDIEMPRMDGYTLTYNIKHDPVLRVLPVLLHSSITNDNMISRATEVEADGFIPKCDPKELAEQLRKYL